MSEEPTFPDGASVSSDIVYLNDGTAVWHDDAMPGQYLIRRDTGLVRLTPDELQAIDWLDHQPP